MLRIAFGNDFLRSGRFWISLVLLVLVAALVFSFMSWEWIRSGSEIRTESLETGVITTKTLTSESVSSTLRNIGLIVGGIVAVLLAMWRSLVAERQAGATLRQAEAAFSQAQTAERQSITTLQSFINDRYEQGARKLESDDASVRLDGIDALKRLAKEHPERYHVPVMSRLCSFMKISSNLPRLGAEVEAIMTAIGSRNKDAISLENNERFELDLSNVKLQKASLNRLNLSDSNLMFADLSGGSLLNIDLSKSRLQGANFKDAMLIEANLSGAQFCSGEDDYPAIGLTQEQLDSACSYTNNPPHLGGVLDADTGAQLNPPTREPGWLEKLREQVDASLRDQSRTE